MSDPYDPGDAPPEGERPQYTVYRSRPKLLSRGDGRVAAPPHGEPSQTERRPDGRRRRFRWLPGRDGAGRERRRWTVGRVVRIGALALLAWCGVSLVLFLVSAQIQEGRVSSAANAALQSGGFTLTTPNTILFLGSDLRTKENAEPGSSTSGPSRSDSIMLLRMGGGANSTLSIPRDTVVDIPGHGRAKINAAYAIGGAALAVRTVSEYLGIPINHLVEVNFENFPALIDSLGGIEVRTGCVVSFINGGKRNGGYTLRLRAGVNHLDGDQALALARTRKNACKPAEDDRTRAARQQKILAAIKDRVTSFSTFVRLPWVSWSAPQAIKSDMAGPSLLGLVGASLIGGKGRQQVLRPAGLTTLPDGGSALIVSDAEKRREVARFLRG